MPGPQQLVTVCFHNRRDAGELAGSKTVVALEFDGLQPEFRPLGFPFNVHMGRFFCLPKPDERLSVVISLTRRRLAVFTGRTDHEPQSLRDAENGT